MYEREHVHVCIGVLWVALWGCLHTSVQAGIGLCEQICEPVES